MMDVYFNYLQQIGKLFSMIIQIFSMAPNFQFIHNIILIFIIVPVLSIPPAQSCSNPLQPVGTCTSCNPSFILRNGYCFKKIRGCLSYQLQNKTDPQLPNLACTQCQNGYVLQNQKCIRQALASTQPKQSKYIPPVDVSDPGKLVLPDPNKNEEPSEEPKKNNNTQMENNQKQQDINQASDPILTFINKQRPNLSQAKIIDIQKIKVSQDQEIQRYSYQNGIIIIIRVVNQTYTFLQQITNQNVFRSYDHLQQLLSNLTQKGKILKTTSSVNYDIQLTEGDNKKTITINIDQQGNLRLVSNQEDQVQSILKSLKKEDRKLQILVEKPFEKGFNKLVNKFGDKIPSKIQNIEKVQTDQKINYVINFNEKQNASITYYKANSTASVMDYNIDGVNKISQQEKKQESPNEQEKKKTDEKGPKSENQGKVKQQSQQEQEAKQEQKSFKTKEQKTQKIKQQSKSAKDQQTVKQKPSLQDEENIKNASQQSPQKQDMKEETHNIKQKEEKTLVKEEKSQDKKSEEEKSQDKKSEDEKSEDKKSEEEKSKEEKSQEGQQEKQKQQNVKEQLFEPIQFKKYSSAQIIQYIVKNSEQVNDRNKLISFQQNLKQDQKIYEIELLTLSGLKRVQVTDSYNPSSTLTIQSLVNTNNATCAKIDIFIDSTAQKINKFLRASYSLLKQYDAPFVQYRIKEEEQIYRFLYPNPKYSQVEVIMKFSLTTGKYSIKKSLILNYGYKLQDIQSPDSIKLKKLSLQKYGRYLSQSTGTSLAYYMANGTHARLYYSSPKASYEYINKKDGSLSGKLMLIENKEKNKIPENFEASKIMTKSERQKDGILLLIVAQIKKKYGFYFTNAPVNYAQKSKVDKNTSYDVVLKASFGYFSITGSMKGGEVQISALKRVKLVQNKQRNCQKVDSQDRCIECKDKYALDKQKCYKRLEGCEKQLGNSCIICERDYVQNRRSCSRNCDSFI